MNRLESVCSMRRSNFSRQLSTVPLQQRSLSLRPANVYSLSVSSALFQSPAKRRRNSSSSVVCRLPQQVPHPTLIDRQIDGQIFSIGSAFSFAPRPLSLIASSNCRFSLMFRRHLYHRSWGTLGISLGFYVPKVVIPKVAALLVP